MKNKRTIVMLLMTLVTLILGVVAVITSMRLRELATVPVAPTAPESKPRAAAANNCLTSFTVAELPPPKVFCISKEAYKDAATYALPAADKIASGSAIIRDQQLIFKINYKFDTPTATTGAKVVDTLPAGFEYVSGQEGCSGSGSTVTCTIGNIAAGITEGFKAFKVKVKSAATAGSVTNSATVSGAGVNASCSLSLRIEIPGALQCVYKKAFVSDYSKEIGTDTVARSSTIGYRIYYKNDGTLPVTNVTITDTLPTGVEFVSADPATTCTHASGKVTCTIASVPPTTGTNYPYVSINVKVKSNAEYNSTITNVATVAGGDQTSNCEVGVKVEKAPKCFESCNSDSDCPTGLACKSNKCVNPTCPTESDCDCSVPKCDDYCANDGECPSNLKCLENRCRNASCPNETDCSCLTAEKPAETPRPTAAPQEALPQAGSVGTTVMFLGVGGLLLILGILAATML